MNDVQETEILTRAVKLARVSIAHAEALGVRCKACAHLASSARSTRMECNEHDLSRERAHVTRLAREGHREIAAGDLVGLRSTLAVLAEYALPTMEGE